MCERVLAACPSGGAMRNDVVLHFAFNTPFGGLGSSGYGNAHGESTRLAPLLFGGALTQVEITMAPSAPQFPLAAASSLGFPQPFSWSNIYPPPLSLSTHTHQPTRSGKYGLRTFSHERAFVYKPCAAAFEFHGVRYPPFTKFGGYSGKVTFSSIFC